jgi:hypothetical protein
MATILAHIVIREGKEAEFEALVSDVYTASHATEKALRAYEYWRAAEPRKYYTLLSFDDYLGFMEHQVSEHHETPGPLLRDCIETISLEWVDPLPRASKLPASNPQDVPADASKAVTSYAKRFPVQVADWWLALRKN